MEGGPIQPNTIPEPQQLRDGAGISTALTGQICRNSNNQRHRGAAQHLGGFGGHCMVDLGSELDPGPRDPHLLSSNQPLSWSFWILILLATILTAPPGLSRTRGLDPHPVHAVGLVVIEDLLV